MASYVPFSHVILQEGALLMMTTPRRGVSRFAQRAISTIILASVAVSRLSISGSLAIEPTIRQSTSAQQRVEPIVLGMSTALTGPAAHLGINMRSGVQAALSEANRSGGIHGQQLQLVVLDDGYEPARTAPNIHRLIDDYRVQAIIGNVGTPTSISAITITSAGRIPFFGAFTGAGALRKSPPDRYVINYRASYAEETACMVDALVAKGIAPHEIGFFTQYDSYGDDGFFGGLTAIRKYANVSQSEVAHGRYTRNTQNVESALADLLLHEPLPKAVIMVGAYSPCAKLMTIAKENGFAPQFLAVSFVGSDALCQTLGPKADGVIVTQVVPHFESDLEIVKQYRAAMSDFLPDEPLTFGSLEGYVMSQVFLKSLTKIDGKIDSETITTALESLGEFDIGLGRYLSLSPQDHQASSEIWPVRLQGGEAVPMNWEEFEINRIPDSSKAAGE